MTFCELFKLMIVINCGLNITEMITRERENVSNLFKNTLYPKLYSSNLKDQMHTTALHGGQKG